MKAGYGRGYYGDGQLVQTAPPRRRSWFKVVAVLGVGTAVVWLLWPRNKPVEFDFSKVSDLPAPTPQVTVPPITINVNSAGSVPAPTPVATCAKGAFLKQVENDALLRGFLSVKDYEASVIASAKQVQATGAQVVLPPHLQHLAAQLGSEISRGFSPSDSRGGAALRFYL